METTVFTHQHYRDFLRASYVEKSAIRPSYSLRAFARDLGLSPAGLTRILKGDKSLSLERASLIAPRLGLKGREAEYFCLMVQLEQAKGAELKSVLLQRLTEARPADRAPVTDLTVDYFKVISDWYHLAILEALQVDGLEHTAADFARYFGIKPAEAQVALERLERLELIERGSDGKLRRAANRLLVSSKIPNEAMRSYYRQALDRAQASITEQGPQEKVIGTEVFAFDADDLDEARKLTDRYFDQMLALARKRRKRRQVYQLAVQFFRLNREERE